MENEVVKGKASVMLRFCSCPGVTLRLVSRFHLVYTNYELDWKKQFTV